jgi:hypothetical protein
MHTHTLFSELAATFTRLVAALRARSIRRALSLAAALVFGALAAVVKLALRSVVLLVGTVIVLLFAAVFSRLLRSWLERAQNLTR